MPWFCLYSGYIKELHLNVSQLLIEKNKVAGMLSTVITHTTSLCFNPLLFFWQTHIRLLKVLKVFWLKKERRLACILSAERNRSRALCEKDLIIDAIQRQEAWVYKCYVLHIQSCFKNRRPLIAHFFFYSQHRDA